MRLAECFDRRKNTCVLTPVCSLKPVLNEALDAFLSSLNQYSLADLLKDGAQQRMASLFVRIESSDAKRRNPPARPASP